MKLPNLYATARADASAAAEARRKSATILLMVAMGR